MDVEQTKHAIQVMQAFVDGKTIERIPKYNEQQKFPIGDKS